MNKNLYRLVFNRALGVLQVVAEIARRPGGSGLPAGRPATAALRPVSFALWLALGWVGFVEPATAQQAQGERHGRIVPDRAAPGQHRPTVLETRNGVPLVNITTPSEAGVSRNIYSQFDVGTEGAILNNSRSQVQTQLGGGIDGNPWLATGTARVIADAEQGGRLATVCGVAGQALPPAGRTFTGTSRAAGATPSTPLPSATAATASCTRRGTRASTD